MLQPYAEQVRLDTGTDFVVVMSRERTRWSHPDTDQIGGRFLGTVAPALRGETFTETFTGTLGPSVRAVTPVRDEAGEVVALVSVGLSVDEVGDQLRGELPLVAGAALLVLLIAGTGTLLLARRVRRLTYGLGAEELSRMYACYDAVLHSVREGLVVLDPDGRVQLANDEARRLLDLPADLAGRRADGLGLPGELVAVLEGSGVVTDAVHLARDRVVVVSGAPAAVDGRLLGRVVTLRDRTDLRALAGDLDAARGLAEALRSQAHESANRLHTVVSLLELGRTEEAVGFAVDELAAVQALTDRVVGAVEEPVVAAVLLGKSTVAAERGVDLVLLEGTELDADGLRGSAVTSRDLVTVLGNLLDNAVDAALAGRRAAPRRGAAARGGRATCCWRWPTAAPAWTRTGGRGLRPRLVDQARRAGPAAGPRPGPGPGRADRAPAGRHGAGRPPRRGRVHRPAAAEPARARVSRPGAPVRVLVVEDEPVAAQAHEAYVGRVPGFEVVGVARTGADALRLLAAASPPVDLVLLDMHLPDRHGLDVVRAMRAAGHPADVVAVTSARDLAVVRAAVCQAIVQYLLKPFVFAALRDRLERYARYREQMGAGGAAGGQDEVDRALPRCAGRPGPGCPRGSARRPWRPSSRWSGPGRRPPPRSPRPPARPASPPAATSSTWPTPGRGPGPALRRRRPPRGGVPLGRRDCLTAPPGGPHSGRTFKRSARRTIVRRA